MQTEMIYTYLRFYGLETSMDFMNTHVIISTNTSQEICRWSINSSQRKDNRVYFTWMLWAVDQLLM